MPSVTGIRETRGIVEISVDGCAALRVRKPHFDKCPLGEGDEIDVDAYADRVAAVQFADGYEAALTSLDYSARTAREIGDALRRKGFVAPCVDAVVARLTESGIIDDERYAQRMAEVNVKKPVGLYAFRRKLRAKGISDEDAEAALASFDDAQQQSAALAAAQKLYRKYAALPEREGKAKLSQALARRGFGWDAIESALDHLFE